MSSFTRAVANHVRVRVRRRSFCSLPTLFYVLDAPKVARTPICLQPQRAADPSWTVRKLSMFNQYVDYDLQNDNENLIAQHEAWLCNILNRSPERVHTEDYLIVLRVLASSKLPDAALRAERWLRRLEQHSGNATQSSTRSYFGRSTASVGLAVPTSECYQRVIEAWADAMNEDPARVVTRAERWLWKQIESPYEATRPDTACFNAFLDICTKGRALKGSKRRMSLVQEHAQKAENVLRFMIAMRRKEGPQCRMPPNAESFNYVIRGWTRCRKSKDITNRTMDALSLMEQYQSSVDPSVRPDSKTYGMTMDAISVRAKLKAQQCHRPGGRVFLNDPSQNGLEEIQLLTNMISFFHEKRKAGDTFIAPNTFAYNILLSCWANIASLHDHAPSVAENILRQMTSFKEQGVYGVGPDSTSYLMVMRVWANSSKPNRGQRVVWLLSKQWNEFNFVGDTSLRPTVDSYNTVIRVWISLMEPLKAEKALSELHHFSEQVDSGKLRPNSESFSLIIRAWLAVAENGSEMALRTAAKWLDTLEKREQSESGISSSVELYTSFLGAARNCASHSPQVLDLAVEVFEKLKASRHIIECLHYSRLLQVGLLGLSKSKSSEVRNSFIEQVVSDCKEAGLVSSALLQALSNGPVFVDGWTLDESKRVVCNIFPQWPLPSSWIRNVKQEGLFPKEEDLCRTMYFCSRHGVDPFSNQLSDAPATPSDPSIDSGVASLGDVSSLRGFPRTDCSHAK